MLTFNQNNYMAIALDEKLDVDKHKYRSQFA